MAILAKILDVQFGPIGSLWLVGEDTNENPVTVEIALTEIATLAPRLVHAAADVERESPLPHAPGTPVPPVIVHIRQPRAFEGKDNKEACLALPTLGGTFHVHLTASDAITVGKDLQTIGAAALPPDSKNLN